MSNRYSELAGITAMIMGVSISFTNTTWFASLFGFFIWAIGVMLYVKKKVSPATPSKKKSKVARNDL